MAYNIDDISAVFMATVLIIVRINNPLFELLSADTCVVQINYATPVLLVENFDSFVNLSCS